METLASVNSDGDVAWTGWSGELGPANPPGNNATSARLYIGDEVVLPTTLSSAWAVGMSERWTDGNGIKKMGVTGSEASSQRLTDRTAILWSIAHLDSATPEVKRIDLGQNGIPQGMTKAQQSAAYSILAYGPANQYLVGGFVREKVNTTPSSRFKMGRIVPSRRS